MPEQNRVLGAEDRKPFKTADFSSGSFLNLNHFNLITGDVNLFDPLSVMQLSAC